MDIAETISCQCNECNILICISLNDWIEVSTSYSTYESPGAFTDPGLEMVEQIREGSKDSELEGCLVKPLRCHRCKTTLGVRCVEAPVEKRTNVNRSYLKLTKMTMKSITSGNLVEAKPKKRQNNVLDTSPKDPLASMPNLSGPTSSKQRSVPHRRGSEIEDTEAPSSGQIFELNIGQTADLMPILGEQRRDIDRVMASVNILQQDMISVRESVQHLEDRRDQASQDFAGDVDLLTDSITKVSSRLSELDALKLEMKMMQQRIKRMEDSRPTGRRSSTGLGSAQVSNRPSPTIDEKAIPRNDATSNGLLLSATQSPMSAYFDGLLAPQKTASERHNAVDGGDPPFQRLSLGSKAEALPPQKIVATRPRTLINGTASRGSHTSVNMPPPQIPRKGPDQSTIRHGSSTASDVATPRTASTSITGNTDSTILPRNISQLQETSTGSHQNNQDDHKYDDELVDDVRPQSSTGSSTRNSWQPAGKTAQNRADQSAQQPPPKTKRRQSVPVAPPISEPSDGNKTARGRTTHRNSKRRKTTAFDASTPSTSVWDVDSRDSRSSSGRRDEHGLLHRANGEVDGRSARYQNLESKGGKKPGKRDRDGYLLKPDGTRDPRSVKSVNQWKKKKAEAELSG
ncbi:hypothetical protein HO173_005417 [Letharia columbiana]|uniref:Uncharacterized protein n=1 Tax=Letharia columbiana TaxID=112416 RepID=A0A8H6FXH8_9LECA|nr:uncharacterized protein HO173_005417 [Letharia columbiana]KAF6236636.1 hypothetical protein HO173_005417 [Letharia columbiana]